MAMHPSSGTRKSRGHNPKTAAVVSFCVAILLSAVLVVAAIQNRTNLEHVTMEQVIMEKTIAVNEVVSKLLYKTQALAALVVQSDGEVGDFDKIASTIVDDPSILNVLLAPSGVVTDVYPNGEGEQLIGFDYFSDSAGNTEARTAVSRDDLTVSGPFLGAQGRTVLAGRYPVWLEGDGGTRTFWGIVSVTLKFPEVLDGAGLDALELQGFAYEIWRTNPDDGARQVIAQSSYPYSRGGRFIEREVRIMDATWHFRISPVREWYQYLDNWLLIAAAACISVLIAFLSYNNAQLRQVRRVLENQEQAARKLAAEAQDASRAKSIFLATMSHEIRTPMNGIIGFAELAFQDESLPAAKANVKKIWDSARGLSQLVDSILDLSKIEAGKIELEIIPFRVDEVLGTCMEIAGIKLADKPVALGCTVDPALDAPLMGDPTRLRQVLLNLLSNAAKFTDSGSVRLFCAVESQSPQEVTLTFEVADTGIGMTREQLRQVEQPFVQGDSSTTRKYGGTGLGLTISRHLVELMGGALRAESAPGQGSRFGFTLVFAKAPADALCGDACPEAPTGFHGQALVCEDTPLNQDVIQRQLRRAGLSVVMAGDGAEGVALARERLQAGRPFDVVFMDIYMPVMDGLEAAKALRELGNTAPVVAMTANVFQEDRAQYEAAGMAYMLAKPFTYGALCALLAQVMPSVPALSREAGLAAAEGDEALLDHLCRRFAREGGDYMDKLAAAAQAEDFPEARRLAHSLKGMARLIGAPGLAKAAQRAEDAFARATDDGPAEPGVGAAVPGAAPAMSEAAPAAPETDLAERETALEELKTALAAVMEALGPND